MKRSKINAEIKHMEEIIQAHGFEIPPFCKWTAEDWKTKGAEYNEIRDNMLGWDITDYGLGKFDGGIIHGDQHIAASPVNDILHFIPVEMHGSHLAFFYQKKFFCISFGIFIQLQIAVSDGNQGKSYLVKFPKAVVCDIPS